MICYCLLACFFFSSFFKIFYSMHCKYINKSVHNWMAKHIKLFKVCCMLGLFKRRMVVMRMWSEDLNRLTYYWVITVVASFVIFKKINVMTINLLKIIGDMKNLVIDFHLRFCERRAPRKIPFCDFHFALLTHLIFL